MELKCLLMWLVFGSVRVNGTEKCPPLQRIEFADVVAETYPLGSKLYYKCDDGYERRSGQYLGIHCENTEKFADWRYGEFECIDKNILLSMASTKELEFRQKPENKTQSHAPEKRENVPEFDRTAYCGTPKSVPHASLRLKKTYSVGQVLHFKCQKGYDKQPPTSGTCTCKKVNGKIIWTPLDMQCTNDSSHKEGWSSPIIESDPSVSLWFPVQSVSGTIHPSFSSSMILPVTAIFSVLLIIPAIFV
nr:PREDICTED: interleukin-2 receptor subunit alpha-like [Struthio camelus australis]